MNNPVTVSQMATLLSEWVEDDQFFYSTKPIDWVTQSDRLCNMEEGYMLIPYYYAYAISYIIEKSGQLVLSSCKNKWEWAQGVGVLAGEADWDAATFRYVIAAFGNKLSDDIIGPLAYGIRLFCKKDFDKGLDLMAMMPNKTQDCLSGLMMNDFDRACECCEAVNDKEQFAQAFVRTEKLDNDAVCHAFDIAVSFETFVGPTALAFFLKALSSLDNERRKECEDRIRETLLVKSFSLNGVLCNWLLQQESLSPFMEDCIMLSLAHLKHPKDDVIRLDQTLCYRLICVGLFEKMAAIIARTYGSDLVFAMENCLHKLRKNETSFIKMVLTFVLHVKGNYRCIGRKMWDEYHLESSRFDPLTLTEAEQILFIVSMLQDLGNPELRLPKVLPLFLSPSEKVRESLFSQMFFYADNYMRHVTSAIDKLNINTNESKKLKQYIADRGTFIQKRRELKELSPMYSQYRYFQEANRVEKETISQSVKIAEGKYTHSWMNMMKREVLARGGGWRLENGKTQHLTPVEFSVPSKIMIQSMTPLELDKWIREIYKDWNVTKRDH